ncbi:hypothetical protein [Brevundimonas sp.]|uniref:hypothetical protein n=1 Tax=Brevundimonas sp. TaxID=1871086 RepID=UPI002731D2A5|nr:hypothetical protein [Brevundimonas sp.]MDP1914046.1 hypothetical protein [Brevundimonas sp.]
MKTITISRFTRLESDILDALAWDLRDIAPDLAGQFAESLPGARRNTGSGLFTELIVDRSRPPPLTEPTGRFGTVHAMVGDLPDPVAFLVELRQGRLLALHGDAYGQDTCALDFARVPFDQVFTLNDQGDSVAFDPAALMQPSPLLDLHQHADHQPLPHPVDPPLINLGALQRVQDAKPQDLMGVLFGTVEPAAGARPVDEASPNKADQTSLLIGVWVAIAVGAVVMTVIFRLPWPFAIFLAVMLGRLVRKPRVLSALGRATRRLGQYEYRPPQQ